MNDFNPEAEIRKHFSGAALEKKMAELQMMRDPERREAAQKPLFELLNQTIWNYVQDSEKKGVHVCPADVTVTLMNVMSRHMCITRDNRLPFGLIMQNILQCMADTMVRWFSGVTNDEAKTQPGG